MSANPFDTSVQKKNNKDINQDLDDLISNYDQSINISKEQRSKLLQHGELEPVSSRIGLSGEIKKNHYMQLAMRNPVKYIQQRTDFLMDIKNKVDKEFIDRYKEYTQGKYKIPPNEARSLALKEASNKRDIGLMVLESLFPSEFGDTAYKIELAKQLNQKNIDFSN